VWWGCVGSNAKVEYFGVLGRRSFPQRRGGLHHRHCKHTLGRLDSPSKCQTAAINPRQRPLLLDDRYHRLFRLPFTCHRYQYPAAPSLLTSTHTANSPQSAKSTDTSTVAYLAKTHSGYSCVWWLRPVLVHEQALAAMSAILTDRQAEEL
jgi:hypothetical protein